MKNPEKNEKTSIKKTHLATMEPNQPALDSEIKESISETLNILVEKQLKEKKIKQFEKKINDLIQKLNTNFTGKRNTKRLKNLIQKIFDKLKVIDKVIDKNKRDKLKKAVNDANKLFEFQLSSILEKSNHQFEPKRESLNTDNDINDCQISTEKNNNINMQAKNEGTTEYEDELKQLNIILELLDKYLVPDEEKASNQTKKPTQNKTSKILAKRLH